MRPRSDETQECYFAHEECGGRKISGRNGSMVSTCDAGEVKPNETRTSSPETIPAPTMAVDPWHPNRLQATPQNNEHEYWR